MVEPMGFEPTNLTLTPDDSIGLGSLNLLKTAFGGLVLDRNWTEIRSCCFGLFLTERRYTFRYSQNRGYATAGEQNQTGTPSYRARGLLPDCLSRAQRRF
jgi:hypothetical protein